MTVKNIRKRRPEAKFALPKDIRFLVYTNAEIMGIISNYVNELYNLTVNQPDPSTETINDILARLDRMKFLIGQIKQGAK